MKKSELKKRLVEALTPDEAAKVEPKYKETYAAMIRGKGPLKLKKYDNPDKVVRGRVVNAIKNESLKIAEKLGKTAKIDDYIDDFRKSDAKQFRGKSQKKIDQMATAAFLNKEEQKLDEIDAIMEKEDKLPVNDIKKAIKALLKKEGGAAGLSPILKLSKDFDNVTQIDIEDILDNDMKDVEKHRDGDYILKETGQEISKKNMDDYKRLNELVKAALMGPISEKQASTDKYDDNPGLKGKQSKLPDALQKGILGLEEDNVDEAESPIPDAAILKINTQVKDKPSMAQAMVDFYDRVKQKEQINFETDTMFDKALDLFRTIAAKGKVKEDVVKGSNIKKVGDKYRVLSGKTGKMWKQKYDSKKDVEAALRGYFASQNESLKERILKELRGSINEMAGEDLELKSLAKKMIPIFKKYGMRVDYKTDTKSIEMKPKVNAGSVPATLIIRKQPDDKGGQFGMLTVAVYWLSLANAKNDRRLGLQEIDMGSGPSKQDYKDADEMANKIYKELMAVVPKGEFDSIAPPKMNRWGNYLIHFRLKK